MTRKYCGRDHNITGGSGYDPIRVGHIRLGGRGPDRRFAGGWKRASVWHACGPREFIVPWQHRAKTRNRFARMRAIACIERGGLGFIARGLWLDVTDADFAQMAIGGLLKEIPTRPQPRRPKSRTK